MMKKVFSVILTLLLVFSFAGCTASNTGETKNQETQNQETQSQKTSFGLNETATFKELKVTATELKESQGENFFKPESGNVFVGIQFTIENISDKEQALSSLLMFTAYADDVKCGYSISAAASFADGTLDGSVAAGKKLVGWYAIEVPENWATIEVEFKANLLSSETGKFVFTK